MNKEQLSDFSHHDKCSGIHQGAYCYRTNDIRGAICGMTSQMLDKPDKAGIYPTTEFYNKLESYIEALLDEYADARLEEVAKWIECELLIKKILIDNPNDSARNSEEESGYNHGLSDSASLVRSAKSKKEV